MADEKQHKVYGDALEFLSHPGNELPKVLICSTKDPNEFNLLADFYREKLAKKGLPFETVTYVAEPGDFEKFSSEYLNQDFFANAKLFVIKSGLEFFKSVLARSKSSAYSDFQRNADGSPDTSFVLVFYDHWEAPKALLQLFGSDLALVKSKPFYPSELKQKLNQLLKFEGINMEQKAADEFIHRVPPQLGSYLTSIRKLKLYSTQSTIQMEDIESVLFPNAEFNAANLVDNLFSNNRYDFFREFSKFRPGKDTLLVFLNICLTRLDQLRKFKILQRKYQNAVSEKEETELLEMQSYSPARIKFTYGRLKREAQLFKDTTIRELYDLLLDINVRIKRGSGTEESLFFFRSKMLYLFSKLDAK